MAHRPFDRTRRILFLILSGLLVAAVAGCAGGGDTSPGWTFGPTLAPASGAPVGESSAPVPASAPVGSSAPVAVPDAGTESASEPATAP